jgi:hypothetical protein
LVPTVLFLPCDGGDFCLAFELRLTSFSSDLGALELVLEDGLQVLAATGDDTSESDERWFYLPFALDLNLAFARYGRSGFRA